MSLTIKELEALLNVLSPSNTDHQTFEAIAATFHSHLAKADYFKICSALLLMLQHSNDLLETPSQRLSAIFLIYECYKNEQFYNNPFASVFTQLLHPDDDLFSDRESSQITTLNC